MLHLLENINQVIDIIKSFNISWFDPKCMHHTWHLNI